MARVQPPAAAERGRRFLILPFRNLARSAEHEWLVEGSTAILADALGRWREIRVVPDDQLYPALRRNGLVPGAVMEPTRVRRVAEQTGGWTVVTGDLLATGARLRVTARAYDAVTGRELTRTAQDVAAGGDVRAAYEPIARALLRLAGLDATAVDLGGATTQSLEAYRTYLRGLAHLHRSEPLRAREALQEAVRLDSTFAQAYAKLAWALMNIDPIQVLNPRNPLYSHVDRAAALSARLPARDRERVQGLTAALQGRLTAGRQILERLVAEDSSDLEAMEALANLEFFDVVLLAEGGVERLRGSFNRSIRLHKRVLELDPGRHEQYAALLYLYGQAAGDLPGLLPAYRQEAASLAALFRTQPARIFVPVMRDSIELLPVEAWQRWPRDSVVASRARALAAARAWVERWLAVAPVEAEAHRSAARVFEVAGEHTAALRELAVAESLGVETGWESPPARRVVLLAKLGRYAEGWRLADSLWLRGYYEDVPFLPSPRLEPFVWTFNLSLLLGRFDRADTLAQRYRGALRDAFEEEQWADVTAGAILSGAPQPPFFLLELPLELRLAVLDSVLGKADRLPPSGFTAQHLIQQATLAARESNADRRAGIAARALDAAFLLASRADSAHVALARRLGSFALATDSTLRRRVEGASWYRP